MNVMARVRIPIVFAVAVTLLLTLFLFSPVARAQDYYNCGTYGSDNYQTGCGDTAPTEDKGGLLANTDALGRLLLIILSALAIAIGIAGFIRYFHRSEKQD